MTLFMTLANTESPAGVRWALAMFVVLVVLLGLFLLAVAAMMMHRRKARRDAAKQNKPNDEQPDPWKESARRMNKQDS